MAEREYIRLTRSRRRRKGIVTVLPSARSSLWLGADHLLKASATFGTEQYRRFYFRDIQAIIMRETSRRRHLNYLFTSLLVLSPLWIYYVGGRSVESFIYISIAIVLFGVPMLVNNILGASCDVQLRTAVQVEDLPSLSRIGQTFRILNRIRPLIVSAQGELPTDEITARLRAAAPPSTTWRTGTTSPLGLSSMTEAQPAPDMPASDMPVPDMKDADLP